MKSSERKSGIEVLGTIPWGTHFCMFYQTQGDLLEILVPYFKAGLENNEYCMWITSEPLNVKDAEKAMRMAIPKFDTYVQKNQIEIIPYTELYQENNEFDLQSVLNRWVDKYNGALDNGFNGLRLTGNTFWQEDKDWKVFNDFEEEISNIITSYNIIAVCAYSLEICGSFKILDAVRNHQRALFRREGTWEIFKGSDQTKFKHKLKESEVNYKILSNELETILDLNPGIMFCKDRNDIITRVNQNFADLLKLKKEDIIGKTTFDLFPKDQAEAFRKDDLEVINTGKPKLNIEEVADFPDKKIWSTTSKVPYYNDKGEIKGIIGLAIDITEHKKAEQKLKESEKSYRELLENMIEGYYALDLKGNFTFVNNYFCKTVGYSKEELIGKNYRLIYDEKTSKTIFNMFNQLYRSGIPLPHTNRAEGLTNRGKQVYLEGISDLIYDSEGNKTGFYGFVRDITEKIISEQKLRESEQRLKSFMNSATDGFILFDAKLNYIDVNNVTLQILGMTREEIIGKNILDIAPNLKETGRYDKLLDVIKTGEPFSTDNATLKGIDGSLDTPFSVRAFKVGDNLGLIITDITEIKRVELKLREKNIELSVLNKIITLGNESTSLQEFLEKSYDQVLEVVNFDRGGVYLYDPETHHNKLVLHKNIHPDFIAAVEDVDISGEPFNMVFDKNNPFYIEDFSEFMEGSKDLGVYSAVIIPLRSKDEYIGSMNVGSNKYQILSQKDLELLVALGNQMGIIIQKFESEKLLKESEEILRSTLESTADGILVVDEDGRVTHTNSKFADMWRIPQDLIAERDDQKLLDYVLSQLTNPEAFISKINQLYRSASEGFDTLFFKDSRVFERSSSPLIHAGEIKGRVWSFRDVTKQKISEQKLKESEQRLTSFMNSATDGFILYDAQLNYIDVNKVTLQTIEMTREEIIGKNILDIVPNLKETGRYDKYMDVIKTGEPFSTEDGIFNRIDGQSSSQLSIRAFKVGDNLGIIFTDITERKKKEKEIFDLAQFPSENPYPVLRVNRDDVIYINYAGQKLFNIIDYSQIPNIIKENVKHSFESNQISESEVRFGENFYSFTFTPIRGTNYVNIYGMDITERKHVEENLREVSKLKSEFLRRASHELKTPLISIKGYSELILSLHEDQLDSSIISKLREINAGCERLQNIINNLLKSSRLESPELRPSKQREDLSFLINFCVLELEPMAEKRKHSIKLDIHDQLYANIEKEEIHDVLSNLLSNAIKYTPPRGKIEIKTELKEEFVVVSVKDNGIGFNEDQKKKLFQQFGKIERYGQGLDLEIDGTGLGLFISKRIVESHGGKIWMESEGKNMGSTFYFSLPKKIE